MIVTEELHLITFETEVYHQGLKIDLEVRPSQNQTAPMLGCMCSDARAKMPAGVVAVCPAWIYFSLSVSEKSLRAATPYPQE